MIRPTSDMELVDRFAVRPSGKSRERQAEGQGQERATCKDIVPSRLL